VNDQGNACCWWRIAFDEAVATKTPSFAQLRIADKNGTQTAILSEA
jgi:hypothetical protein